MKTAQPEELLTYAAKRDKLTHLIGAHSVGNGKLFAPTPQFYNSLHTDDGLQTAAHELARWMGIKPYQLRVRYSNQPSTAEIINVPEAYRQLPYQCAALLSFAVLKNILRHRLHYKSVSDSFIEFASIEFGLGIVILNGIHTKPWWFVSVYLTAAQLWHYKSALLLTSYSPSDYAQQLYTYTQKHKLSERFWISSVSDDAYKLLPVRNKTTQHQPPQMTLFHQAAARRLWGLRIVFAVVAAGSVVTLCYGIAQQPQPITTRASDTEYQKVVILRHMYHTCTPAQQQTMPCEQLKNQFVSELHTYNAMTH